MRPLFLVVVFLWAVPAHVSTLVIHVLTYTHVGFGSLAYVSVAVADCLLLVTFVFVIRQMSHAPSAATQAIPTPRWVYNLGGLVVLFGVILIPYCIGNFLFLVYSHPTKKIPAYAEIRLATGFGLVTTYFVVIVVGGVLARRWWPGVRWIDEGTGTAAEPGAAQKSGK